MSAPRVKQHRCPMCRDDVELITAGMDEISSGQVHADTGGSLDAYVIALPTGFKTLQILNHMDIRGKSGKTLRDQTWEPDDARAGNGESAIHPTEFQAWYILRTLDHILRNDVASIEPKMSTYNDYNTELDAALAKTVWSHREMSTYNRNAAGRIV